MFCQDDVIKKAHVDTEAPGFAVTAGLTEQAALDLEKEVDEGLGELDPDAANPSGDPAQAAAATVAAVKNPHRELHSFEIDATQVWHTC